MSRKLFNEWDEYDDFADGGGYTKLSKSNKRRQHELENVRRPKRGHHKSPSLDWEIIEDTVPEPEERLSARVQIEELPAPAPVVFAPDATSFGVPKGLVDMNTRIVKGNEINYDRVIDMCKVENDHNGRMTYGIKFIFHGTNAQRELSRIAWFNVNQMERDRLYIQEQKFWQSLQGDGKDNK